VTTDGLAERLHALGGDSDRLRRLHDRLTAAADTEHLIDVAYRCVDTPVGSLLIASTEIGVVRVAYQREDHDHVLTQLAVQVGPRILHHPGRLDDAARQIDQYFAGDRRSFDIPLDWRLTTGFRSIVLHHLGHIAYGHTATYGDVARLVGNPRAVRAVGTACATNPLPVVVPCHRVVRSDGTIGAYLGGADAKAFLLDREAAA
jgi:methylated-DNA-[protein]-cysteine S-methyltransferase